jgi:hypothetical protein
MFQKIFKGTFWNEADGITKKLIKLKNYLKKLLVLYL